MKTKIKDVLYKIFIKYQLLLLILLALDQITKRLAVNYLGNGEKIKILGDFFTLELTYNQGIAFSLLSSWPSWALATISIIACLVIEYYLIIKKVNDKIIKIGLIFIVAGALGNGIDRTLMSFGVYKGVIDFFSTSYFAIFNVADIYVTLSCIGLLIYSFFGHDDDDVSYKELKKAKKELEKKEKEEKDNKSEENFKSND